ncbi:MAG: electron transport protein SCO1/SenC [Phycisphaerales bacterium]|nr:electron transport protein SCO1/SenC [Phycisphaerales bacterium]
MKTKTYLRPAALLIAGALALGCYKMPDEAVENDEGPLFPAPTFNLTDQDNHTFSSEKLKGKTWIATLFYTSCPGPCPLMSGRLRKIQKAVPDPNVVMVSFSIDPEHDTPAKLKDYATNMTADPARWFFLTGSPADMEKLAAGLKLGYESPKENADNGAQIVHSTKFLLVDKTGQVRGVYSTADDESMKKLETDAKKLAAS